MAWQRRNSGDNARLAGLQFVRDWVKIILVTFRSSPEAELEHGSPNLEKRVPNGELVAAGRIALAHIRGLNDYYRRLDGVEADAANEAEASAYAYWGE